MMAAEFVIYFCLQSLRPPSRKRPFGGHSRDFNRHVSSTGDGWQLSADRASLPANSLLTGNFRGKYQILGTPSGVAS